MKKTKIILIVCMALFISNIIFVSSVYGEVISLKKKDLLFDKEMISGWFKYAPDMRWIKKNIYIVAHRQGVIFKYLINLQHSIKYIKTIGRSGEGPGELSNPVFLSVSTDRIGIVDQRGLSIFSFEGRFIQRFRIFLPKTSFLYIKKRVYQYSVDPNSSYLMECIALSGKRIFQFGEKWLKLNFSIHKDISDVKVEGLAYRGDIVGDSTSLYYISRRFGMIIKYSLSGKRIWKKSISNYFGENGKRIIMRNKELFFKKGINMNVLQGRIPTLGLYRQVRLRNNYIYLLSYYYTKEESGSQPYFTIIMVDRETLKIVKEFRSNIKKGNDFTNFDVQEINNQPFFLVLKDTVNGYLFSIYSEVNLKFKI